MSPHFCLLHISLTQATTEFEDLIASLKISTGNQQTPPPPVLPQAPSSQSDGPLSPQSFAMVSITDLFKFTMNNYRTNCWELM